MPLVPADTRRWQRPAACLLAAWEPGLCGTRTSSAEPGCASLQAVPSASAPAKCLLPRKKPFCGRGALQVAFWGETHLLHGETAGDVHLRCVFRGCRACVVQQLGSGGRWEALVCLRAARGENQAALGPGSGRMARRGGGTQPGRGSSSPRPGAELGAERRQLSSRAEHCSILLPPPFCCLELLPGRVKLCSLPEPAAPRWVHVKLTRRCRLPRYAHQWDPSCLGHPGLLLLSAATGRGTVLCHGAVAAWPEALASVVRAAGGAVAAGCRAAVSGADALQGVGFGAGAPPAQHGVVRVAASPCLLSVDAPDSVQLSG